MRTLEILLIIFVTLRLLAGIKRSGPWLDWLSIATQVIFILHLWLEGYRWQMIPAYVVVLVLGFLAVIHFLQNKRSAGKGIKHPVFLAIGLVFLFLIIILPPLLLPIPSIYPPDGPYAVGTFSVMLVDQGRQELYSGTPNEPRRLMVQFWYPAEPQPDATYGPWVENPEVIAPAIAEFLGFPSFFLDHLKYANGNAYPRPALAARNDPYPLLLFSHGWSGFRAQNTFQMVSLASHGYVVAAPDHAYGAIATVFADGKVAYNNPMALPTGKGLPEDEFMTAAYLLGEQWSGDLSFILDSLTEIDPNSDLAIFQNHLDFERIGALGHSTGGGAALQFCVQDSRCQAVLGMDPYMDPVSPDVLASGTDAPMMAMFSEGWASHRDDNSIQFDQFRRNSTDVVYSFNISGTAHFDFSDLPAFSPLASTFGLKGPIPGDRALRIITDHTLAFFGQHLLGVASEILSAESNGYPEVNWK